jgi:Uma2 family endonuclease
MPVQTQIPIEVYLNTSYEPDCDFVDGELQERDVGKTDHARIQALLASLFGAMEDKWDVLVLTEQRVQISPTRIRIPDITVVSPGALDEDVLTRPPLICIEILSPEDRYSRTRERALDYRRMGVENIWLIDPTTRSGQMAAPAESKPGWLDTMQLFVNGSPILIDQNDLFARLDRSREHKA